MVIKIDSYIDIMDTSTCIKFCPIFCEPTHPLDFWINMYVGCGIFIISWQCQNFHTFLQAGYL